MKRICPCCLAISPAGRLYCQRCGTYLDGSPRGLGRWSRKPVGRCSPPHEFESHTVCEEVVAALLL